MADKKNYDDLNLCKISDTIKNEPEIAPAAIRIINENGIAFKFPNANNKSMPQTKKLKENSVRIMSILFLTKKFNKLKNGQIKVKELMITGIPNDNRKKLK